MAEQLVAHDRYEEAEQWTAKAEQGHPRPGVLHFRVARLLRLHRQVDAAIRHFEKASAIDPSQPEVEYGLGQALVDGGRSTEAIPHLQRALKAGVRVDLAGFDLARAQAATGDRTGAVRTLQSVRTTVLSRNALEFLRHQGSTTEFTEVTETCKQRSENHSSSGISAISVVDARFHARTGLNRGCWRERRRPKVRIRNSKSRRSESSR